MADQKLAKETQRPDVDVTHEYLSSLPLQESDIELVKYLGEVGYATAEQMSQMYGEEHEFPLKSAQKWLTQLWKWHLLDRTPCAGLEKYGIQPQLVYSTLLAKSRLAT